MKTETVQKVILSQDIEPIKVIRACMSELTDEQIAELLEWCGEADNTTVDSIRNKTGIKVKAWKRNGYVSYIGEIDIADLKPGMLIREVGSFREVTGKYYDNGEDYMIPVDNDEAYSPLLFE